MPCFASVARGERFNYFLGMFVCRTLMSKKNAVKPAQVIGPLGEQLTLDSLPSPQTRRWVARRKAEVVAAVEGGLLTFNEACERYSLSMEELTRWQCAVDGSGLSGLRVTRTQQYRHMFERRRGY
jgi:hypothetical protein